MVELLEEKRRSSQSEKERECVCGYLGLSYILDPPPYPSTGVKSNNLRIGSVPFKYFLDGRDITATTITQSNSLAKRFGRAGEGIAFEVRLFCLFMD